MLLDLLLLLAFALVATTLIEISVAFLLGHKSKEKILAVIGVNVITNPALNFFLQLNYQFKLLEYNLTLILLLETCVVIIEFMILYFLFRKERNQMLILSIAMNTISFLIGLIIFPLKF